jgi:hypothetical protein
MANATDLASVRQVLRKHKQQITRDYHATGTGIGKKDTASKEYVIVVYVKSKRDIPSRSVSIEGVSLRFLTTGEFYPLIDQEK